MNEFISKIEKADTIALFGHVRPDGDCIGSCLGVYNYIVDNYPDKHPVVFLQPIQDKFKFMKGSEKIKSTDDGEIFDLGISLDCGDTDRHANLGGVFKRAKDSICIDHHKSNTGFGNFFYCEADASSACEVVTKFLDMDKISLAAAECLYTGIVHDTGVFKYSATDVNTMICAGKLMQKGINTQEIIDNTYYKMSYNQNRLTGQAVVNSKLHFDGKVITTIVTSDMMKEFGTTPDETDGIVDQIRETVGIEVAIFAYQLENRWKFSMRSVSYVDVSEICVELGGGGHVRAAGVSVAGNDIEPLMSRVLELVKKQLR